MSSAQQSLELREVDLRQRAGFWTAFDRKIEAAGDRLNPILVKEARQALKSRQFVLTFLLVLLGCWLWSIFGIVRLGESVYYGSYGPRMFMGYYMILAAALLLIIPYSTYRSLAGEREDKTFELLSITTLTPAQIIAGKMASSVLQMLVYLSAIGPCLAFTYVLRGMDVRAVAYVLICTLLASFALSLLGLFAATLFKQKHWQVMASAGMVMALIPILTNANSMAREAISWRVQLDDPEFWVVHLAFLTVYFAYAAMIYFAAAAQLSFASDNKSTRLRIVMFVQHGLLAFWLAYGTFSETGLNALDQIVPAEAFKAALIPFAVHWYLMGALLSGESPQLSYRVRRSLPQSGLARALFTWFNPGPSTGIVFALLNLSVAVLVLTLLSPVVQAVWWNGTGSLWLIDRRVWEFGGLTLAYVTFFLCIGKLVVALVRKVSATPPAATAAIHALLLLTFSAGPTSVAYFVDYRTVGYSLLQLGNPIQTLSELFLPSISITDNQRRVIFFVVPIAALAVLMMNVPSLVRELRQSRLPKPLRVKEDDAEAANQHHTKDASPWTET